MIGIHAEDGDNFWIPNSWSPIRTQQGVYTMPRNHILGFFIFGSAAFTGKVELKNAAGAVISEFVGINKGAGATLYVCHTLAQSFTTSKAQTVKFVADPATTCSFTGVFV